MSCGIISQKDAITFRLGVRLMTPEQKAREVIDKKLEQSGWIVQDMSRPNLYAGLGVAFREFPTSTGPVDYALFIEGTPVGIIELKLRTPKKPNNFMKIA